MPAEKTVKTRNDDDDGEKERPPVDQEQKHDADDREPHEPLAQRRSPEASFLHPHSLPSLAPRPVAPSFTIRKTGTAVIFNRASHTARGNRHGEKVASQHPWLGSEDGRENRRHRRNRDRGLWQGRGEAGGSGRPPSAPTEAAPPAGLSKEAMEQLQKLSELHKSGILTDEEFATQKARILG